jgi:hypothetical protein
VNLDGASDDERVDLFKAGASCFDVEGAELRCSPRADRLARSGVYELQVRTPCLRLATHFGKWVPSPNSGGAEAEEENLPP